MIDQLQKIHALRDELELDPTTFRETLQRLTGSMSARYMTATQRALVITALESERAILKAQAALDDLKTVLSRLDARDDVIQKQLYIDGKYEGAFHVSIEQAIRTIREIHGNATKLTRLFEFRDGSKHYLELYFERAYEA